MAATTWSTTDKSASMTLSGGNLIATAGAALQSVRAVHPKRTGKYYIEYSVGTVSGGTQIGFGTAATPFGASGALTQSFTVQGNGSTNTAFDSFGVQITGLGFQSALVISVLLCAAIDLDNALIWFRVGAAAVWNNNAANNPATGIGGISLLRTGLGTPGMDVYPFLVLGASTNTTTANFGASAFTGAVPAGFTSGWDDSVAVVTNEVVTQTGVEEWGSSNPAMQATQIGVEEWGTSANPGIITQVSAEHWAAASPDAAITQVGVEHWATVQLAAPGGTLYGVFATGLAGTVTVTAVVPPGITLAGVFATGVAGTVTALIVRSVTLAGVAATGLAGIVTGYQGPVVVLPGVAAAGATGSLFALAGGVKGRFRFFLQGVF